MSVKIHTKLITTSGNESKSYFDFNFNCCIDQQLYRDIEKEASMRFPGDFDLQIGYVIKKVGESIFVQHNKIPKK